MKNNIIDFNTIRNEKILNDLDLTEIGSITITVLKENNNNYVIFSILPSMKELDPIVDVLDDALVKNTFIIIKGAYSFKFFYQKEQSICSFLSFSYL